MWVALTRQEEEELDEFAKDEVHGPANEAEATAIEALTCLQSSVPQGTTCHANTGAAWAKDKGTPSPCRQIKKRSHLGPLSPGVRVPKKKVGFSEMLCHDLFSRFF